MDDLAAAVPQDHQNKQNIEGDRWDGEKVDRTLACMVFQESAPGL